MKQGLFITLEGGEGGGKSTQSRLLKEKLEAQSHQVVLTREPGGTPEAEKIRALFMDSAGTWSPIAECMLLFAARAMHVRDCIKPALEAGKIVICDRFTDSTRAYQGYAGGMDLAVMDQLKQLSIGDFEPDL
ncbi:MAG: dTMP kinase, partial [Alphaproteobacteria bacterium]|nr:dTMP kinase [Alphaproteobacteria bacterium]